jgi:hypothetical protein
VLSSDENVVIIVVRTDFGAMEDLGVGFSKKRGRGGIGGTTSCPFAVDLEVTVLPVDELAPDTHETWAPPRCIPEPLVTLWDCAVFAFGVPISESELTSGTNETCSACWSGSMSRSSPAASRTSASSSGDVGGSGSGSSPAVPCGSRSMPCCTSPRRVCKATVRGLSQSGLKAGSPSAKLIGAVDTIDVCRFWRFFLGLAIAGKGLRKCWCGSRMCEGCSDGTQQAAIVRGPASEQGGPAAAASQVDAKFRLAGRLDLRRDCPLPRRRCLMHKIVL